MAASAEAAVDCVSTREVNNNRELCLLPPASRPAPLKSPGDEEDRWPQLLPRTPGEGDSTHSEGEEGADN